MTFCNLETATFNKSQHLFNAFRAPQNYSPTVPRSVLQPLTTGNIQYATSMIPISKTPTLSPQYGYSSSKASWNGTEEEFNMLLRQPSPLLWSAKSSSNVASLPSYDMSPFSPLLFPGELDLALFASAVPESMLEHESVSPSYSSQPSHSSKACSTKHSSKKESRSCDSCLAAMKGAPLSAYSLNVQVLNAKEVREARLKGAAQAVFQQKKKEQHYYCNSENFQLCSCKFFRVIS